MNKQNEIGEKAMGKSIEILRDFYESIITPNECQNERYFHHYYSKKIQEFFKIDCCDLKNSQLHPEWPTFKKSTHLECSKYLKKSNKYIIDKEGSSGFIDFAIGNYDKPEFAIEFTSKYGFNSEDLIFDFIKLLDSNNPFEYVISFNIIYREKDLPKGGHKENIITKLKKARYQIINKDEGRNLIVSKNRQHLFWIVEIAQNNNKRSWVCDDINECDFKQEEPDFQKYKTI